MALHLCHPYVWEDPRFIFKSFMYDGSCMSEIVNRVVLVYVVFLVIGFILGSLYGQSWMPLLFGMIATCFLIPTFMKMKAYERFKDTDAEGFSQAGSDNRINYDLVKGTQLEEVTSMLRHVLRHGISQAQNQRLS